MTTDLENESDAQLVTKEETETVMLRAASNCHKKRGSTVGEMRIDEETYKNLCTANCGIPSDTHMIDCNKCDRYTHFRCTKLPNYQISQFMSKGYRKYVCPNCCELLGITKSYTENNDHTNGDPIYDVPNHDVKTQTVEVQTELVADSDAEATQCLADDQIRKLETKMSELTKNNEKRGDIIKDQEIELERLNDDLKVEKNEHLVTKNQLDAIRMECFDINKIKLEHEKNIKTLENTVKSQANIIKDLREEAKKKKVNFTSETIQKEIEVLQSKLETAEKCIVKQTSQIENRDSVIANYEVTLEEQRKKFDEVGNPEFDNLTNMENTLKKTNDENLASLKTFLTAQVSKIENNLKEMVEAKLGENKKEITVLSENINKVSIPPTDVDPTTNTWSSVVIRKRPNVTTMRNAELVEKQEQEKRTNNFIIYGLSETQGDNTSLQENDKILMKTFLQTIEVGVTPKQVMRLGKKEGEKNRLLKVVMSNSDDKEKVMSNLNKLKNANENLRCISVRDDYTQEERNLLKAMNDEAKKKNEQDNVTHWKVRGSPKNGLRVVKITARKQQEN